MKAPLRKTLALLWFALPLQPLLAQADLAPDSQVIAQVGELQISVADFRMALNSARRERYYHAAPPESERTAFENEILEDLIERALLLQEARRRELVADEQAIARSMEKYRAQYGDQIAGVEPAAFYGAIEKRLREDDLIAQLRQQLQQVGEPTEEQVHEFYTANPDKFTQPEQLRLSLILLAVDPAAPAQAWEAARLEAEQLVEEISAGADFEELARLNSADLSASNGGDMGLVHVGRLSGDIQSAVEKMRPGQVSEPVTVLEGMAIFRLDERHPPSLSAYEVARDRAADLWRRDAVAAAWDSAIGILREQASISINQPLLSSLRGEGG